MSDEKKFLISLLNDFFGDIEGFPFGRFGNESWENYLARCADDILEAIKE